MKNKIENNLNKVIDSINNVYEVSGEMYKYENEIYEKMLNKLDKLRKIHVLGEKIFNEGNEKVKDSISHLMVLIEKHINFLQKEISISKETQELYKINFSLEK